MHLLVMPQETHVIRQIPVFRFSGKSLFPDTAQTQQEHSKFIFRLCLTSVNRAEFSRLFHAIINAGTKLEFPYGPFLHVVCLV